MEREPHSHLFAVLKDQIIVEEVSIVDSDDNTSPFELTPIAKDDVSIVEVIADDDNDAFLPSQARLKSLTSQVIIHEDPIDDDDGDSVSSSTGSLEYQASNKSSPILATEQASYLLSDTIDVDPRAQLYTSLKGQTLQIPNLNPITAHWPTAVSPFYQPMVPIADGMLEE